MQIGPFQPTVLAFPVSKHSHRHVALHFGSKSDKDEDIAQQVEALLLEADTLSQHDDYLAALSPAKQAYEILKKAKRPDLNQRISAASMLANIHYNLGAYDNSKKLLEEAMDICQHQFERPAVNPIRERKAYREYFLTLSELALSLGNTYFQRGYQQLCARHLGTPQAYKSDFEKAKALFEKIIRGAKAGYRKSRPRKKTPRRDSAENTIPLPQEMPPVVFRAHLGLAMLGICKTGFPEKNNVFKHLGINDMLTDHPYLCNDALVNETLREINTMMARFYAPSRN